MRFIVCLIALLMMSQPAFAQQPQQPQPQQELWFNGGTLQKASVSVWMQATPANQLATSADFVASLSGLADPSKAEDPIDFRKRAEELRICVNTAAMQPGIPQDRPVAELVVRCAVMGPQ